MKITIYLKNGTVLPAFDCENFSVRYNAINGEPISWSADGCNGNHPMYIGVGQIAAVYQETGNSQSAALDQVAALEAEMAMAMTDLSAAKTCESCKHEPIDPGGCFETGYACKSCEEPGCVCNDCDNGSKWEWRGNRGPTY